MDHSASGIELDDLVAQVVDEYLERMKGGDTPTLDEFVERYPEIGHVLKTLIPALNATQHGDDSANGSFTYERSKQIGDFRILSQIGRGGMGVVYEAEQVSMKRRVALKVLPLAGLVDELKIHRFQNEVRAVAALNHPNIVPVYMVGQERGIHYYAMQLIHGRSLSDVISSLQRVRDDGEPLDGATISQITNIGRAEDVVDPGLDAAGEFTRPEVARDAQPATCETVAAEENGSTIPHSSRREYLRSVAALGIQAASALQHAHEQGVIHRDIKPANLLLDSTATLFVTDFGLARMESDVGVTMTGDLIGTLRYMAPEQALAKRVVVDHRADIYSLGVTLYELVALQPAYRVNDRQELLKQIAFEEPTPLRRVHREIPTELETIIHKAMSKDMDQRYASAHELADDLRSHLENRPIKAKPPTLSETIGKWTRRNLILTWATIITLSLVTLTLGASILLISQQLVRAKEAEQVATLARDESDSQASELARQNYLLHVASAGKALLEENYLRAQVELNACLESQRGWEWHFLANRIRDTFPLTLSATDCPIFTREGKRLIAIEHTKANIWDLGSGKVVDYLEHSFDLNHLALSTDETRIAGGDLNGNLCVWDIQSGRRLWLKEKLHDARYDGLAFSPDGRLIATANWDGRLKVIDADSGDVQFTIALNSRLRQVMFSSDGHWIACGTYGGEEPAMLINAATGKIVSRFSSEGGDMLPIFAPSNQRIATANKDGSIRLWNWDGEQLVEVTSWHAADRQIRSIAFSADGTRLVSTDRANAIQIWDVITRERLAAVNTGDVVYWSAFSPSGDEVAMFSVAGGIRMWRWRASDVGRVIRPLDGPTEVMFSPNGKSILAAPPMRVEENAYYQIQHQPGSAAILDAESGEVIHTIGESLYAASWSTDGREITASSASEDAIRTYDSATGEHLRTFPINSGRNTLSRADSSEQRLISFATNGTLRKSNLKSGEVILRRELTDPTRPIAMAAVTRDARRLGIALFSPLDIEVWDTRTATLVFKRSDLKHYSQRLVFSVDGDRLYVGGWGGQVIQLDTVSGKAKHFLGHQDVVSAIAVAPDDLQIVSGDLSGRITVWDVANERALIKLADGGQRITSLDWSSDGRRIVAGKEDGTVQIWTLPITP